jgi:TonB family protein
MRVPLLLASLLLTTSALAAKVERLPQRLVTSISADVTVGPDGQLQSIGELSTELDPQMRELVLAEMRAVEFSPGRIDGRPVAVQTGLSLTLGLRDGAVPGDFVLELVDVGTGPSMTSRRPPKYPPAMLARGREATVMTHLRYDADGRVTDAEIIRASVPEHHVRDVVLRAAQAWRFDPERADGKGLAGEAFVPVRFTLDRPAPTFVVRLKSGTRLEFAAEMPSEERDEFASALEAQFEVGRVLDIGVAQGGS